MAKTKTCAGVPKLGIAKHEAKTTEFTVKVSRPDGLSRRCKACQSADRKARRGGAPGAPKGAPNGPGRPVAVVDGTEVQAQELAELEAAIEAAGGNGTDAGQALLLAAGEQAAAARRAADAERKRRQRAAAKAAASA